MPHLDASVIEELLRAELLRREVAPEAARHVAGSLTETSLRGVDSHGIHLFPYYVTALEGGRIQRRPDIRELRRAPSVATLDADHGFGHHAGSVAMGIAIELAEQTGVGAVGVRRSTHFGAAAYFGLQASRRGFIGVSLTNADALVKAHGSRQSFFGTNPICFTVPLPGEDPLCLDMATSRVSWNKIVGTRLRHERIPEGWACDGNGVPTTDPDTARMLLPIGEHKGFGLGFMVEILCALLNAGPLDPDLLAMYGTPLDRKREISHYFMALRIDAFTDPAVFSSSMRALVDRVRALTPDGDGSVMVPGDPEKKLRAVRTREGIPILDERFEELVRLDPGFERARIR